MEVTAIQLLLIDDDAVDRATVRRALKNTGLQTAVVEVEDYRSAQQALHHQVFDCIVLDYRLPDADGLQVIQALRAAGTTTPILVLTGQGDEQIAVDLMKAGATDYLIKSRLSADRLGSSLRHALRLAKAERTASEARIGQRHAEAVLRQNERLLALTLKSIGEGVIATDARGHVVFLNRVAEVLTEWEASAAEGQPIEVVLPLLDAQTLYSLAYLWTEVLHQGKTVDRRGDLLGVARDGRRFPLALSSAPMWGEDARIVGMVVVFQDITAHVQAAQRLRLMAEASRVLAASLNHEDTLARLGQHLVSSFADLCAIDLVQPDGTQERIVLVLRPHLQTLGGHVRAPLASTYMITHTSYLLDATQAGPEPSLVPESPFAAVLPVHSWIAVPLLVQGERRGAIGIGRTANTPCFTMEDVAFLEDVAQRAALAVEHARLYHEAQEAVRTRDAFLSIASHELKTPLTALQGYIDLLQRRVTRSNALEQRDQRALGVISDQARRLNRMIQALFDLSRLQLGQLTIERVPVELASVVTRICTEISPTLQQHTLHIIGADEAFVVMGDVLRLEQVIQNLIHNAVKYSPAGGDVTVRFARHDEWCEIRVEDQGIGIPAASLPHIFQRFFRATNTEGHRISGMGVGLFVVGEIIELHGGRVEVASVEGEGSTFSIWLPLNDTQY